MKAYQGRLAPVLLIVGLLSGCNQGSPNIATPFSNPNYSTSQVHPYLAQWGGTGGGTGSFHHPTGVAVNAAGTTLTVADQLNNRLEVFAGGNYLTQWPATLPSTAAGDSAGNVYTAVGDILQVFNSSGTSLVAQWGSTGSANGQLRGPTGIALDSSSATVYVADTGNNRAQLFDPSGNYLGQMGSPSSVTGNGFFNAPQGVAVNAAGTTVYVADTGNNRIQALSPGGIYLFQWGGLGVNQGQFNGPRGVAAAPGGGVYVADTGNNRIQEFTSGGAFKAQWGGLGDGGGRFNGPSGIAVDGNGNIYVADTGNDLVQKFGP